MNRKSIITTFIGIIFCLPAYCQLEYYTEEEKAALKWLESKIGEFKNAPNDSVFVSQNSESTFHYVNLQRGDQERDIEQNIYNSQPGNVVGPFHGGKDNYLLKIISYQYKPMVKVGQIKIIPKESADTSDLSKVIDKLTKSLSDDKQLHKIALKNSKHWSIRINDDTDEYWEGERGKEAYDKLFNGKKDDYVIIKKEKETKILRVKEEKKEAPYRVKAIPLVKRTK
jgi:peptidyl-prolyl cis-trans isomerase D